MPTRAYSPLSSFSNASPNMTAPRTGAVRRLTPHCVAGNLTAAATLNLAAFKNYIATNGASCNYAIGSDGKIGCGVAEMNRSWATSSRKNDHQAITFEIANTTKDPDWRMSDEAINAWLDLSVEIAKFYGFKSLFYKDKPASVPVGEAATEAWINTLAVPQGAMLVTLHRWYANKACPGNYFIRQLPWLVKEATKRLSGSPPERFVGEGSAKASISQTSAFKPYGVKVTASALRVRSTPTTVGSKVVGMLSRDSTIHYIAEEAAGTGASKWGKLASGLGWISLDFVRRV